MDTRAARACGVMYIMITFDKSTQTPYWECLHRQYTSKVHEKAQTQYNLSTHCIQTTHAGPNYIHHNCKTHTTTYAGPKLHKTPDTNSLQTHYHMPNQTVYKLTANSLTDAQGTYKLLTRWQSQYKVNTQ